MSTCSASVQRQSYPNTTNRNEHLHSPRRNVHSAPATLTQQPLSKQASETALSSSSGGHTSESSTAVASSSSTSSKDVSHLKASAKVKPTKISTEDRMWANKINAELAAQAEAKAKIEEARATAKAKRGCIGAIADEFDFGYANVPKRVSKHGRSSAGGVGLGACDLM